MPYLSASKWTAGWCSPARRGRRAGPGGRDGPAEGRRRRGKGPLGLATLAVCVLAAVCTFVRPADAQAAGVQEMPDSGLSGRLLRVAEEEGQRQVPAAVPSAIVPAAAPVAGMAGVRAVEGMEWPVDGPSGLSLPVAAVPGKRQVFAPRYSGPDAYWDPCPAGAGSGETVCRYMQSTGPDTGPLNCARWQLGAHIGFLELEAYVPSARATATVDYLLEYLDAETGEAVREQLEVRQADVFGWVTLLRGKFRALSMELSACNNSALEGIGTHRWIDRLIGVDAASVTCLWHCDWHFYQHRPVAYIPVWLDMAVAVYPGDRIAVEWDGPRGSRPILAGYRVRYALPAEPPGIRETITQLAGRSAELLTDEDTIVGVYETPHEFHYSPPLTPGKSYKVEVAAVDAFGREVIRTAKWVALDPEHLLRPDPRDSLLGAYETWDNEDVDNEAARNLRTLLDIAGVFDPIGAADLLSAVISFSLGDDVDGYLSLLAILPYIGDIPKARKLGNAADALRQAKKADLVTGSYGPAKNLKGLTAKQKSLVVKAFSGVLPAFGNVIWKNGRSKLDAFGRPTHVSGPAKFGRAQTDASVRTSTKEAIDSMRRTAIDPKTGKKTYLDNSGHIMPDVFGGPYNMGNVVVMDKTVNGFLNTFMEQGIWQKLLKESPSTDVFIRVELKYDPKNFTRIPDEFVIHTKVGDGWAPSFKIKNDSFVGHDGKRTFYPPEPVDPPSNLSHWE